MMRVLLEAAADAMVVVGLERTVLELTNEVLAATSMVTLRRRAGLTVIVEREGAVYEWSEVERVVEEERGKGKSREYLLEWKDEGGNPFATIAVDIVVEYKTRWWTTAWKAYAAVLSTLLADESIERNVGMEDEDGQMALHFATKLGYRQAAMMRVLLEAAADAMVVVGLERTVLELTNEVLAATSMVTLRRRAGLTVIVEREGAVYEWSEVERVVEEERGKGKSREYLLEWKDEGGSG
ncbi:probable signal recognition particle 43 kDa protein, chloroplastic [Elaeis guineensis]|uniref:probable signal recognition particle 43 kDa protein, chloroplastic n=1 Tax=Elaeis guineensis var. tenera TaxID=51953 RepID=UPI003C6D665B